MNIESLSLSDRAFLYDVFYIAIKNLFAVYNPCKIDKQGRCVANKATTRYIWSHRKPDYVGEEHTCCCASRCKHLGRNGCEADALGCKFYICDYIGEKYPAFEEELRRIIRIADRFYVHPKTWLSKEEWLKIEQQSKPNSHRRDLYCRKW